METKKLESSHCRTSRPSYREHKEATSSAPQWVPTCPNRNHMTHTFLVCSKHRLRKSSFQKLRSHHYIPSSWRIKPPNLQMKASSTPYKCRVLSVPSVKVCPLVGIDALGEHTPHEGNRMVLIVTFSISQNRIARKFYTEFCLQEVTTCQNPDLSPM